MYNDFRVTLSDDMCQRWRRFTYMREEMAFRNVPSNDWLKIPFHHFRAYYLSKNDDMQKSSCKIHVKIILARGLPSLLKSKFRIGGKVISWWNEQKKQWKKENRLFFTLWKFTRILLQRTTRREPIEFSNNPHSQSHFTIPRINFWPTRTISGSVKTYTSFGLTISSGWITASNLS